MRKLKLFYIRFLGLIVTIGLIGLMMFLDQNDYDILFYVVLIIWIGNIFFTYYLYTDTKKNKG